MFPLWDVAISPLIEVAGATRILEIGALRGETTVRLLDRFGADAEIHVIDPQPEFDPGEHESRFPGRYIFYRNVSHNVLPLLPAVDVALIDGDHNWFTVYHELRMLAETSRAANQPLPILIMHDVLWPYGRRDLYYAPGRIPEAYRHPYAKSGMRPGRAELLPDGAGGVSPALNNAVTEGGPRNGVMTALEDFMRDSNAVVRVVVLPIYFGLAIVVDEQRLQSRPQLTAALDRLESAEGRRELLELAESLRLTAVVSEHNLHFGTLGKIDRAAKRYLALLKGALLNEHYLELEERIEYLVNCSQSEQTPDPVRLHDPARRLRSNLRRLEQARKAGEYRHDGKDAVFFPYTAMGRTRLDHLERCLDTIRAEAVPGDLMECGARRGGGGILMRGFLDGHEMAGKQVWVADPFRGPADPEEDRPLGAQGDLNVVRDGFARFNLLDERVRFLQGAYRETLPDAPIHQLALLRIDTSSYEETRDILELLYDRIALGGFVVVETYESPGCQCAVDELRTQRGVVAAMERIDWTGAFWRKGESGPSASPVKTARRGRCAPLATPLPKEPTDVSVVVCFYNMRREAERTLFSLSRAYQRGVEGLAYEVIVVDNGSTGDRKLNAQFVASFGPEFTYVDMAERARPSPAAALNRGIGLSRGENVALMIDGAHVLTPGVLRYAMLALRSYSPAVVATQQWYVGPGQQNDAVQGGYDQDYEDRLFDEIGWPTDGYRLFDIGHFIGGRDWFDGLWESNCLFAPRKVLQQVGGVDESFSMAGGGYANLDLYERVAANPDVSLVTILGEGSFHQVHGGTTTNEGRVEERNGRLDAYRRQYIELRGRSLHDPGKPIHYVGSLTEAARRTRARRLGAPAYFKTAHAHVSDQRPVRPVPMPDDVKLEFTDAFWRSEARQEVTWLGRRVGKCPTDLLAYQELLVRVAPDWIIETGTGGGGRALFLATICELKGQGQVVSIDDGTAAPPDKLPRHPRLTYIPGDAIAASTGQQVRDLVGHPPHALVIFGLAAHHRLRPMWEMYSPLVPVGSYVIFEDTITNGNPVWAGMGPGPHEVVKDILRTTTTFTPDTQMEKFGLTFNPGGYLRRLS